VEIFPGNYEDYLWRKQGGQRVAPTLDDVPGAKTSKTAGGPFLPDVGRSGVVHQPANGTGSGNGDEHSAAPKKRLNPIKRKQMEDRVQTLEAEISRTEDEIVRLETALQSFVSAEETQRQSLELDQNKASHAALVTEWEELAQELEVSE
jgi:ATP-binding cassette, subfamily F, member 3